MLSTEKLLTEAAGFDLPASPLQRSLVRAADGKGIGDELTEADVLRYFGCERSSIGLVAPVLVVVAGVRGGKSLLAACAAVKGCLTSDLSKLKQHEIPRFAIVAPTIDNAQATFRLLTGSVLASSALAKLVVGEPTSDTIVLRRPHDGRVVEIVVVAASRGAVTLRSRWLAGFVFDEVALFGSEPTGAAVNAEELLRAAETRLVPGAQGWLISSPFGPQGLLYGMYRAHFGDPGRVLVVHAPTRAMNPSFPEEQVEAIRARQPDVAAREYDAQWIDAETAFFDGNSIARATRTEPLVIPYEPGHHYACVLDPAFKSNAFTMVLATLRRTETGLKRSVVLAKQWHGSRVEPLKPRAVLTEIAADLKPYGVDLVWSDQGGGGEALRELAEGVGLSLVIEPATQASKLEMYTNLATLLHTDQADLPPVPLVKQDLMGVRKVVGRNGVNVDLAKTPDGRHSDFAPSVAGALSKATIEPDAITHAPQPGTHEWEEMLREQRRQRHIESEEQKQRGRWFRRSPRAEAFWRR